MCNTTSVGGSCFGGYRTQNQCSPRLIRLGSTLCRVSLTKRHDIQEGIMKRRIVTLLIILTFVGAYNFFRQEKAYGDVDAHIGIGVPIPRDCQVFS